MVTVTAQDVTAQDGKARPVCFVTIVFSHYRKAWYASYDTNPREGMYGNAPALALGLLCLDNPPTGPMVISLTPLHGRALTIRSRGV